MSKKVIAAIVVIIILVVVIAAKIIFFSGDGSSQVSWRVKGNPDAPIKIVEFIDFECPACANGSILLDNYLKQHPDKFFLELKYFPLTGAHMHAIRSATYVECAAQQGAFWPFHDKILREQVRWRKSFSAEDYFLSTAKELQLDLGKLNQCVKDPDVRVVLDESKAEGKKLGIKSTPTYFVNGKMVVGTKGLLSEVQSLLADL